VAALDGRPLGTGQVQYISQRVILSTSNLHTEIIQLYTIEHPIILGLPWLEKHNPTISWTDKQIIRLSNTCQEESLYPLIKTTPRIQIYRRFL